MDFTVASAFELFKNDFVHAAAGVDQRGRDDGERAAFFHVARRAQKALGAVQCVGVHAAGEHFAAGRHHVVVGAGQAGDGVQQDDHVFFQLDQAFGALDHHFGHMHVARGRFVKRGGDDFGLDGALHVRDFFGTLVHQQHHHVAVGVVGADGVGDGLHHHRFAALGRSHDEGALAFADGGDHVDDAARDVFLALEVVALQPHQLLRKERREVLEHDLVLVLLGRQAIDLVELGQREIAFAVFWDAHLAFDHVARVQVEAAHLAGADVDVVRAGGVAGVGAAQKAEAVGQDFQHAVGKNLLAGAGALFDDGEHQLLLAHAAGVFDFQCLGLLEHFGDVQGLEFVQVHGTSLAVISARKAGCVGCKRRKGKGAAQWRGERAAQA